MSNNLKSNVVDRDNNNLLYPIIKDAETECVVPIIKNDIIYIADEHASINYFSFDWRFNSNVINCIATKYLGKIEDYPDQDDVSSERFLIGVDACKRGKALLCPYLDKVFQVLTKDKRIKSSSIIAIQLLDICNREENAQKFLLLTKEKVYVRYNTNRLEEYDYEQIIFTSDGVQLKNQIEDIDGLLASYPLADDFLQFAQEYKLLRSTTLQDIDEIHPATRLPYEDRIKYLDFLIDVAVGDGKITADKLLRLEFLARGFRIESSRFVSRIEKAAKSKIKDQIISKVFTDLLKDILTAELRVIFYQDILEVTINKDGELERSKLLELLKNRKFAGEEFVREYIDFIKYRNRAERALQNSILSIADSYITAENLFPMQRFNSDLNLKILEIGVMTNGKK